MYSSNRRDQRVRSFDDLSAFPSELAARRSWARLPVLRWLPATVALGAAAAFAVWFVVVNQPDPGVPQLPEVKERVQAQVSDPDTQWLTPLLLPLALQGFEGPIPPESTRAAIGVRTRAATPAAQPRSATGQAGPGALAGAAASTSPPVMAASLTPSPTPGSIGPGTVPSEIAPRPADIVAPPPAPAQAVPAYRSALAEPAVASRATPIAEVDQRIYDADSPDVVPPVPFDAKALPPNTGVGGAVAQNRMELLIGVTGRVEGVRMASRPARMSDMMMLSGAKNWVFTPATKDGKPVRYRLPLTWTVSQ